MKYSLLGLSYSIVIYCHKFQSVPQRSSSSKDYKCLFTRYKVQKCTLTRITTEVCRVADEAVELLKWVGLQGDSLFVLSYSGLGLLTLLLWGPSTECSLSCWGTFLFGTQSALSLRTKYQISHTEGRLSSVTALLTVSRNNSCLSHWGCFWAVPALQTFSTWKHFCHTTCPLDTTLVIYQNTVCSPSGQDWPNLSSRLGMPLAEVPDNCSPECGDECECKSDPWHRVLLLVLCYTATRLLLLQNTKDPWHSVQLPVLCIYLLEWFQSSRFAVGNTSGNTAELHLRWRVQSLFSQVHAFEAM